MNRSTNVEGSGGASNESRVGPAFEPEAKTSAYASVNQDFVPMFLTASQAACWLSIKQLVEAHQGNVWFWTFTFADVLPHHYAGNCHRNLTRALCDATRRGDLPKWGGVKVAEVHPGGHGIHFHWVVYPRLPIKIILSIAQSVGFGRINVHEQPCTVKVSTYLAKYLTKDKPVGLKAWGCIGEYAGCRVRDVEWLSDSSRVFTQAYREAVEAGKPKGAAFLHAKKVQRQYTVEYDAR